jgi:hypothetical protein
MQSQPITYLHGYEGRVGSALRNIPNETNLTFKSRDWLTRIQAQYASRTLTGRASYHQMCHWQTANKWSERREPDFNTLNVVMSLALIQPRFASL